MQVGVEDELREVQPLIDKAKQAVSGLKSENLSEVRSLKAPPAAIRNVLEAVLRIMGQQDTSWNNMKKFLSGTGVKERVMNFDAMSVTPAIRASVSAIIDEYPDSFDPERIYRVSVAAAPLAEWVLVRPHPRGISLVTADMTAPSHVAPRCQTPFQYPMEEIPAQGCTRADTWQVTPLNINTP